MEGKSRSRVFSDPDPLSCIRRSMLYACGLTYAEIQRPLVAYSNSSPVHWVTLGVAVSVCLQHSQLKPPLILGFIEVPQGITYLCP